MYIYIYIYIYIYTHTHTLRRLGMSFLPPPGWPMAAMYCKSSQFLKSPCGIENFERVGEGENRPGREGALGGGGGGKGRVRQEEEGR
jgi:hypothetical protein